MSGRYTKLSRRGADVEVANVLHEGVPPHLYSSVKEFIRAVCQRFDPVTRGMAPDQEILRLVERTIELRLNWKSEFHALSSLVASTADPDDAIDILDFLVHLRGQSQEAIYLNAVLTEGGSAWRVNADFSGLERRVDETATAAAATAWSHGKAGQHLKTAWASAFGVSPSPSEAYSQAVKAVEVAAHPVLSPADSLATLGKMIAAIKQSSTAYRCGLAGVGDIASKGDVDALTIVRLMMQLLWTGQHDRHGNFDETKPISVSQEEAEAAVHLAALLVQWFETGLVVRLPSP